MSNPTSDPDAELSWIHTPDDLAASLDTLRRRKGLSLAQLERKSKGWTGDRQELKRSTLSDVFTGKSPVSPTFLTSLLAACEVPPDGRRQWREVWARVSVRRPVGRSRFDAASPRDLGIHSAIVAPDSTDELPTYVRRDFDFRLRTALSLNISDRGCFVVLVGGSSTGKTRSLYEAVYELVPNWWLVLPEETGELLALKHAPPRQTVFWLDELQRYLGSHPPLSSECVRALIRQGNIVVGTLWPDQYDGRIAIRQQETEDAADVRRLLKSATVVSVPDDLTPAERVQAGAVATEDSRIRIALDTRDVGLTQALAGGPDLVLCWEQSPNPYAKAMITAAADGHRLGVQAPLDAELLAEAMFGYLRPAQRVPPKEVWLAEAIAPATKALRGNVSALSPVDGGRAGTLAGYTVADYLAQHLRDVRRTACVPEEAWLALVSRVKGSADLRRLADSAVARLRYCFVALALHRLVEEFGDAGAAIELTDLLIRQDRFERAIEVLHRRLAVAPRDRAAGRHLSRIQDLWQRVEEIRPAADAGDPASRARLREILADGGICDDLRARAETGDVIAAERLVERLADRGCLRELQDLADRGYPIAAEALADLYLARGDVDLLQARAIAGDRAAELRLSKVHGEGVRSGATESEVADLRAVAGGDPEAARQLCTLLFELRDEQGLRAEVEAGTYGAADRLIALYTAEESMPPEQLAYLRAFGLTADGEPFTPSRREDP